MSASIGTSDATTGIPPTSATRTSAFWERLWRLSGINALVFFVIAYFIYGDQPHVGAGAEVIAAFYNGDRLRILIAAVFSGMAVLNLMWFAAALRAALADAGQDGWGAAATASGAMVGGLLLLLIAFVAALAYRVSDSGNFTFASGINDLAWSGVVLTSFPRAMLIMAGTFGFWRAGLISDSLFATGVAAVVLVLLGGTAWASGGFWAPDGAYSRLVSPIIGVVWILVSSRILLTRSPAARAGRW